MSTGWIVGSHAVQKVGKICGGFRANRLQEYQRATGHNVENYQPCMSLSFLTATNGLRAIVERASDNLLLDCDPTYLEEFNKVLMDQSHLGSITDPGGAIEVRSHFPLSFQEQLKGEVDFSIVMMEKHIPWMFELFKNLIVKIHPVARFDDSETDWSASDYYLNGLIFTSIKSGTFARIKQGITIAHELSHAVVHTLQTGMDTISSGNQMHPVYSCIRETNRPLRGSFLAAVALTYMALFLDGISKSDELTPEESEFTLKTLKSYEPKLCKGLDAINPDWLTELGKYILTDMYSSQLSLFKASV